MLFLCAILLLSACSPPITTTNNGNSSDDSKTQGNNEESDKSRTTIHWLQHWTSEQGIEKIQEVEKAFEKQHPDIDLVLDEIPFPQQHDKIISLDLAGMPPDIINVSGAWVTEFAEAGIIEPINDRIKSLPQEFQDNIDGPMSIPWKGKRYGMPITNGNIALYYNKKMLEEEGIEPPTTWDELVVASKKLTNTSKNQYALTGNIAVEPPTAISYEVLPFILQAGGEILEDGKAVFNSPEGVEGLEFYKSLIKEYKVTTPGEMTAGEKEKRSNFSAGNTAFMFEGPWGVGIQQKANPDLEFGVVPLPKGKTHGTIALGTQLSIAAKSKNKDAAWEFLKFLGSAEGQKVWDQATNYFPYNKETMKMDFIQNDKYLKVFADQFETSNVEVIDNYLPEADNLRKIFTNEIQAFLEDKKTAQEALDTAADAWNKSLNDVQ
jgi:multiple sugar transport system substrate-binding protein